MAPLQRLYLCPLVCQPQESPHQAPRTDECAAEYKRDPVKDQDRCTQALLAPPPTVRQPGTRVRWTSAEGAGIGCTCKQDDRRVSGGGPQAERTIKEVVKEEADLGCSGLRQEAARCREHTAHARGPLCS